MEEIVIKNKKIVEFYEKNKHISIDNINLIIVDLLEQLINGMNNSINASVSSQIFNEIHNLSNNINKINQEISNNLFGRLQDTKKEYMDDFKELTSNNLNNNNDKLSLILQQNTNQLIDKTNLLLNEMIPKNNDTIKDQINNLHKYILDDTKQLLNSMNKEESLNIFLQNFENKYTQLIQPFYSIVNTSEERINKEINAVKNNLMPDTLQKELSDFFSKFKNSSYKGQLGENQLETILNQLFPSGEIINTSSIRASCDFKIQRFEKSPIFIETKHYDRNVTLDEVKKFIRDIEEQKCNGVFLSQNSGITSKQNFQIDMCNNNILIYLHNVAYDPTIIKTAIDIIDHLSEKLSTIEKIDTNEFSISEESMNEINKEYSQFIQKKLSFIEFVKDNHKKLLIQIDEFKFPTLSKIITQKCGNILVNDNQNIICSICNKFSAQNNKALAAHQRGCKKKQLQIENQETIIIVDTNM